MRGMRADTDRPHERDRQTGPFLGCLTVTIPFVPIMYVLSFGPACWLGNNGYLGDWAKVIYVPLALLAASCPPLRDMLQWYVDLWR